MQTSTLKSFMNVVKVIADYENRKSESIILHDARLAAEKLGGVAD